MTAIEKSAARALSAGQLRHNSLTTSGADIIGALAAASDLGSGLMRVKWANDKTSVHPMAILLGKRLRRAGEASRFVLRLANIVLQEFVDTRCHHCGGTGNVINADRVVSSCTHCRGTGIAQISDQRRIRALRCDEDSYNKKWKQRMALGHSILSEHESDTRTVMQKQLKN